MEVERSNDEGKMKKTPDYTLTLDSYQAQLFSVEMAAALRRVEVTRYRKYEAELERKTVCFCLSLSASNT
jgi:hypothetical protein